MKLNQALQHQTRISDYLDEYLEAADIPKYGGDITKKGDNIFRIAFQNINGITQHCEHIATEEVNAMETLTLTLSKY